MQRMLKELNFKKMDFPIDWNDDVRMNFLFSPFRERSVNPEGYDAKLNFWMNTIQELCVRNQSSVISCTSLSTALERKERQPKCLDVVLENMLSQGLIVSTSDYNKIEQAKGWLGWSFDVLVQKPVLWGLTSVQSFWKSNQTDTQFVILAVVKDLSAKILKRYYELVSSKWTDNAIFLQHLKEECVDICSESNFQIAVLQLQREKVACVFDENGEKVIKFRKANDKRVEPLSEVDKGVLSLRRARDAILSDLETLEEKIGSHNDEAKEFVKKGFKTKAMLSLKKRKRLEGILNKKSLALDNIENLLCQLKNAGSEKMVLEAYRTGVLAMKGATTGDMDLDKIDDVMADVKETLDDLSEIQNTLSNSVSASGDSLQEFEAELDEILSSEKAQEKRPSPSRVNDDDLLKRLAALRAPPEDVPPIKKKAVNKPLRAP